VAAIVILHKHSVSVHLLLLGHLIDYVPVLIHELNNLLLRQLGMLNDLSPHFGQLGSHVPAVLKCLPHLVG
jgi:hypothetical protein